jgi:hypothetical protein
MITRLDSPTEIYEVVHPLDDVPEEKCSPEKLGAITTVALLFEDGGLSQSRKLSYEGTRKA